MAHSVSDIVSVVHASQTETPARNATPLHVNSRVGHFWTMIEMNLTSVYSRSKKGEKFHQVGGQSQNIMEDFPAYHSVGGGAMKWHIRGGSEMHGDSGSLRQLDTDHVTRRSLDADKRPCCLADSDGGRRLGYVPVCGCAEQQQRPKLRRGGEESTGYENACATGNHTCAQERDTRGPRSVA